MLDLPACRNLSKAVAQQIQYNPNNTLTSTTNPLTVQIFTNVSATKSSTPTNGSLTLDWFNVTILIICALGLIGNVLNLLILTRRRLTMSMDRLEKSANYGLIALAISDMGFCGAAMPFVLRTQDPPDAFTLYYSLYGVAFINLFLMSSTWLIVSMAISRYIVVVYPIHARFTLGAFRTVTIIITVYIGSALITIPYFIRLSVEPCSMGNGIFRYQFQRTFNQQTNDMLKFYTVWIWPIVSTFIPLIILLFCNTKLIQELRHASQTRRLSARGQRVRDPSQKVTLTLVVIVLMLFILVIPAELLKYINPYSWGTIGRTIAMVANLMQNINFAFNFVLYCVLSPSFRQTIKFMFPTCEKDIVDQTEMETMLTTIEPGKKQRRGSDQE